LWKAQVRLRGYKRGKKKGVSPTHLPGAEEDKRDVHQSVAKKQGKNTNKSLLRGMVKGTGTM